MKKITKVILFIIIISTVYIGGFFIGKNIASKQSKQPSIYGKLCTDNKTGVQYMIVTSSNGGIAILPRFNADGTLYKKKRFIFTNYSIKGEINEQTNFNCNQ